MAESHATLVPSAAQVDNLSPSTNFYQVVISNFELQVDSRLAKFERALHAALLRVNPPSASIITPPRFGRIHSRFMQPG